MAPTPVLRVAERKLLYRFLAQLFTYPDDDLLAALAGDEAYLAAGLLSDLPRPPDGPFTLEELEIAYTDLFINRLGGAPAPPYGSVYLEQEERLMGPTTLQVATAYRAQGLRVEGSCEPPDFLPTELEFLYFLVDREEQALAQREVAKARSAATAQADFGRTYLLSWLPAFCSRIEQDQNGHPLYRWGATLLERFASCEKEWLARVA